MDILRFINSRDIREHLKNIGYKFNSLEAAWLIYQCKSAPFKEKHEAWQELIETMPDCRIEERANTAPQKSLHEYLRQYMECESSLHSRFFTPTENWFYTVEWYGEGQWHFENKIYKTFEFAQKEFWEDFWEDASDYPGFKTRFRKQEADSYRYIETTFDEDGKIISCELHDDQDDVSPLLHGVFDGLWFDFPTPFKSGDILCEYNSSGRECGCGPFVMTGITPEHISKSTRKYGDSTDMNAWGYFIDTNGRIYSEVMFNYMDLECYRGEFT